MRSKRALSHGRDARHVAGHPPALFGRSLDQARRFLVESWINARQCACPEARPRVGRHRSRSWSLGRMRAGARADQSSASRRAVEALLRRPELVRHERRPRVLHAEHGHRRPLRRAARGALHGVVRAAAHAREVGDHPGDAHREADVLAGSGQRLRRLAHDGQRPGRGHVHHHESLRHQARLQPADRRREQRHRRELDRPPLVRARVHARRLVAEPRHRRVRGRQPLADRDHRRREVGPGGVLRLRPERSQRARLRPGQRLLRRHAEGLRLAADDQHAVRQFPRLLPPRRLRRLAGRRLQPGRGDAPPLLPREDRHRLRARGPDRDQAVRLRLVHRRSLRLRPKLRRPRRRLAPLRRQVQPLAEEPRSGGAVRRGLLARRERQHHQVPGRRATASSYVDGTTGLPVPDPNGKPFAGTPIGADVHRDTNKDGTEDDCAFTDARTASSSTPDRAATSSPSSATCPCTTGRRGRSPGTTAPSPTRRSSPRRPTRSGSGTSR